MDNYVDAIGHEFGDYISNDDATCIKNATETATCNREGCQETHTKEIKNSKSQHIIDEWGWCTICDEAILYTEGIYGISIDGTYAMVFHCSTTVKKINIASTYEGLPVIGITVEAFSGCSSLTEVIIPNSEGAHSKDVAV